MPAVFAPTGARRPLRLLHSKGYGGSGDEDTTSVLLGPGLLRVRIDHLVASAGAGTGMLGGFRLPEGV
jgi:hypothetical protein